ncbi:hypothetical protein FOZ60_003256 [Perkinsus olseni]|uniref:Uncharacterized protein n=1 Tax=Perkinsus olseni TaxID=32597 RepID=A0A7J6NWN3_PEROL|nr:hypothetical protein FOZ60_003256 [Perkinsus olseni]
MEFIRHQKKWMASLGIDKASIEDKIRTILEDAVKSSPGTPRLWQLRLLDHPSPDRKQDRVLWTRAMREPSVASALASSCVQTLMDSSSHSEEAGRDPEALLDVVTGSGVLSSLSMEVVYDILCRVAMYDMEKAVMLFRGVATRALFQKVSPVLGTPSAHYALVGQNIMSVNPGYLGVCESVDASQSAPDDADVEFKLGQALGELPGVPHSGLARDLTKRDGIELVLRLVDILCGSAINSLQRYSCRHPYRLVFHGYFGDTSHLPVVSGYARHLAARCLAHALLACTADDIEESLLLRELIVAAEPSTGRAVVATSTSSVRLWSAYAMTQMEDAQGVVEKCIASFANCLPLKAGWARHKLMNGDLSAAVQCIVDGSSNVSVSSKLEELREGLSSAERTDPPCIGLPSTFAASIWCIWLLGVAKNPRHPEKPLAEFWRLMPSPSSAGDLNSYPDALPTRELWRLQPIGRESTASAVLGVHSPALHDPIAAAYASSKLPTAALEVANVMQAGDRSSAERHCLAGLGRLSMPHRGLWAIRVALIDSKMIDFEDKVVDVVCAMSEAGMEPRSDIVEWLAAVEGRDEG